ncbi:hypothetical protein F0562_034480 [Nyssa sinensis]|uniref:FAS1 domain-containing protein n=1 Tax=Nyssa sinensis TaxID=561372 RepID=A0A5J5AJM7_9ASTE|nr:hypothetical protein F0562_034480 [Nyssa sinensis]
MRTEVSFGINVKGIFVISRIMITDSLTETATIATAIHDASTSMLSPSSPFGEHADPSSLSGPILSNLGFQELSTAAQSLSTTTTAWRGPITIFAPTDSTLLTCPSCSVPHLLQEHTVPGLYSLHYLGKLAFGTKIETLAPDRCITITYAANDSKIFVGGAEITRPDLYNDGFVVVHGIQGFISHLSPFSCSVERMTSFSFLPTPPVAEFNIMRPMLKDAMLRLRISGYSVLAFALRFKYTELLDLRNMTVFALDDTSIFSGGHKFISDLRFHIVPNRLLMAADLERLPPGTVLPTIERGQKLLVTTASGGGPLSPMRINYVKVKSLDVMHNQKIVVHGLTKPFPHIQPTASAGFSQIGQSAGNAGINEMEAPTAGIGSTVEIEDHHGL